MRRNDREIKDRNEIIKVMEKCDVCRLALNGGDYPYILPLNFGMEIKGEEINLYFHGANEGTKYAFIAKDNRASFEMDCAHKLVADASKGYCTMYYESVIGNGKIEILSEEEKYNALCILMEHYHTENFVFSKAAIPRTTVMKLAVEKITGKIRTKKND